MKAFVLVVIVTAQILALPTSEKQNELSNKNETKHIEEKGLEGLKLIEPMKGEQNNKTLDVMPFAAFVGDACPTGKAKVHGICVDID